jgi:4-carboxymuconolactone decarboxylase|tara:strand:- start:121 stop:498 length:378 start_codon:yes stop_codon:yes gene_type:complete
MDKSRFDKGLVLRKEVLGEKYVEQAFENMDDFDRDFQEQFVTEYGWGGTWARGVLQRRERSILNLGMLAGLGRLTEFETHFRGAFKNGLSQDELKEVLLQITAYCGVPMGVEVFRIAKRVLKERK